MVWTLHAKDRQRAWEEKRGVTRQEVEEVVKHPEQIALGDRGILIAQTRVRDGLLRAPFIELGGDTRRILTVYWTSKIWKYWKL